MAAIHSKEFAEQLSAMIDLETERSMWLIEAQDSVAAQWILDLKQEIKNLKDANNEHARRSGASAFNPRGL